MMQHSPLIIPGLLNVGSQADSLSLLEWSQLLYSVVSIIIEFLNQLCCLFVLPDRLWV